jgi:translation initiation factor IF-1
MFSRLRRVLLCASVLLPGTRAQAAGWEHLGNVDRVQELKDGVELSAGKTRVRVTFFRGDIVRVRVAPNGVFSKDYSWAIIQPAEPPAVKVRDSRDQVRITSGDVVVVVKKSPLLVNFENAQGRTIVTHGVEWPAHRSLEEDAAARELLRFGRQARYSEPPQSRLHVVEHRFVCLAGIYRPALQDHSFLYRIE